MQPFCPIWFQLPGFQLQLIIIIVINRYWCLRLFCEYVHAHLTSLACTENSTTNGATFIVASFTTKAETGADRVPSGRVGSVVLPTMRQGIDGGGTVPSIDAFQCAARLAFSVNASVVGGRLHNCQVAPISICFLHILIRVSLMLAHLLKPLPWQASMNDAACSNTIAASACVSPIACSGILAVLATLSALIFPMPNVAADVSTPLRAWMASRSGTIDVCTFWMMSMTARSFTVEHMQSWPIGFISATTWRSRAKTSVSLQITDTTSPTMHLVIAWWIIILSASSWFRGPSFQSLWHLLFQQGHLRY